MGENSPQNPDHGSEYEFLVISGLIYDNSAWQKMPFLAADDFINPVCRVAFSAIQALMEKGTPIDFTILSDELVKANSPIRDMSPFATAFTSQPEISLIIEHGRRLKEKSIERQALALAGNPLENADKLLALRDAKKALENGSTGCLFEELAVSFADVARPEYGPIEWIIKDILPVGVSMLLAKPKQGKSWLALDIAMAVPFGTDKALGCKQATKGDVLYFALEDNQRRMNRRIKKLIMDHFEFAPENAQLITDKVPRLSQGFEIELERYLEKYPNTRLVVVDPFTFIETPPKRKQPMRSYQEDYDAIGRLTKLTREKYPHLAILLVYHMRKEGSGNWLDTVMGTTGLSGAVDNLLFIRRENAQSDAVFYMTGKDIENETEYAMSFDKVTACWQILGEAQEYALSNERQEVVDCIRDGVTHYAAIAKATGKNASTIRSTLRRMVNDSQLVTTGRGNYILDDDSFTPQFGATNATDATSATSATSATNQFVAPVDVCCNNTATEFSDNNQQDNSFVAPVAPVAPDLGVNEKSEDKGQGKTEIKGNPLNGKFVPLDKFLTVKRHRDLGITEYLKQKATIQGTMHDHYYIRFVAAFKNEYKRNAGRVIRKVADEMGKGYPFSEVMGKILDSREIQKEVRYGWRKIKSRLSSQYDEDELEATLKELIEAGFVQYNVQKHTLKLLDN